MVAVKPVPVGMIGNHQRQFDAALARARAHPHPARGERRDRIGKAPRPEIGGGADGGASVMVPARSAFFMPCTGRSSPSAMPRLSIVVRDLFHRAMQVDRRVVAGLADQRDHALRLAERIGADQMRALRKQRHRRQQLLHLVGGIAVAEHRQAERRLGDEDVAGHQLERRAGGIARVLVVAGGDDAGVLAGHRDLRRAQHMAGGMEFDRDVAEPDLLAIARSPACCRQNSRHSAAA